MNPIPDTGPYGQTVGFSSVLLVCWPILKGLLLLVHRRKETRQPKDTCSNPALSYIGQIWGEVFPDIHLLSPCFFGLDGFSKNSLRCGFSKVLHYLAFHQTRRLARLCSIYCTIYAFFGNDDWFCDSSWRLPECLQRKFLVLADSASHGDAVGAVGIP